MSEWDGAETAIVLHERHPKARRAHRCDECWRVIAIGDRYTVERTIWDSRLRTHKTCAGCWTVREWLLDRCGGFVYGQVINDAWESSDPAASADAPVRAYLGEIEKALDT